MKYAIPTGKAAQILGSTEPRLSETVRRGKVTPQPPIIAGRRHWYAEHLIQAAEALGILDDSLRDRIEREAPSGRAWADAPATAEVNRGQ